jgi:uncharacterized protein
MRLIVSSIPDSGIEKGFKLPLSLGDIVLKDDVQVFLKVFKFGERVKISGHAMVTAFIGCSRCLKEFSFPIDTNFEFEYLPKEGFAEYETTEHELTSEELDIAFYQNDEIDIGVLVRELILLAIPMKPLCHEDCMGICPTCGKDLNEGLCGCGSEEIDPRLSKLKRLKQSLEEE